MRKQSGAFLLEILITMSLTSFLLLGIYHLYQSQRTTYNLQQGLSQIQENIRIAADYFSDAIHHAGFIGCGNLSNEFPIHQAQSYFKFTPESAIQGFSQGDLLPIKIKKTLQVNSDLFITHQLDRLTTPLLQTHIATKYLTGSSLITSKYPRYKRGELLMLSDCEKADIFPVENIFTSNGKQVLTIKHKLADYWQNAELGRLIENSFYIAATGRKNLSNETVYALYQQNIRGFRHELLAGISQMKINYGVHATANSKQLIYKSASNIQDWSKVYLVKIDLLFNSIEQVLAKPQLYVFQGQRKLAPDKKLYKAVTLIFQRRNGL